MDMTQTLSDLPTDLHRLILSHDEEKIYLKKEKRRLTTRVRMLQSLLDEARQDNDSDSESDSDSEADEFDNMDEKDIYKRYLNMSFTVPQLRHQLKNAGIKGYSRANKAELVERLATHRTS